MHADPLTEAKCSLAAEFPAFIFSTQRTHGGRSLVAEPRPDVRTPIRVVITSDPAEMRLTLATGQAAAEPAALARLPRMACLRDSGNGPPLPPAPVLSVADELAARCVLRPGEVADSGGSGPGLRGRRMIIIEGHGETDEP